MAGRIYITGDCHGDFRRFNTANFPEQRDMDKEDYVIICGDAACLWDNSKENRYWLKWLSEKSFTTLYIDGNHENFDMLYALEIQQWNGGKVHLVAPSIIHLMRGQIYSIAGKTFFAFGGAKSHDIQDGILQPDDPRFKEKQRRLNKACARYRVNHISWWKEELPSDAEYAEGIGNLNACQWSVDYIISHTGPSSVTAQVCNEAPGALEDYLEGIRTQCSYEKWFFGHYHLDQTICEKESVLYKQILQLA